MKFRLSKITIMLVASAPLLLPFGGCSRERELKAPVQNNAAAARPVAIAKSSNSATKATAPRSTFVMDATLRDPFFPKSKRTKVAGTTRAETPIDIPRLLQNDFGGVIGSGERRIAVIGNVLLEPGRKASIPLRSQGGERKISVRCLEVTTRSVLLDVEGFPEPLTITRLQNP
jgi:hypothetical protein